MAAMSAAGRGVQADIFKKGAEPELSIEQAPRSLTWLPHPLCLAQGPTGSRAQGGQGPGLVNTPPGGWWGLKFLREVIIWTRDQFLLVVQTDLIGQELGVGSRHYFSKCRPEKTPKLSICYGLVAQHIGTLTSSV